MLRRRPRDGRLFGRIPGRVLLDHPEQPRRAQSLVVLVHLLRGPERRVALLRRAGRRRHVQGAVRLDHEQRRPRLREFGRGARELRGGVLARVLRRVEVVVAPEAAPARAPHVLGDLRVVRDHRRRRGARREVEVAPDHPQSLRVVIVAPRLGLLRRVRRGRAARGRERDDRAAAGFEDAPELAERLARVGQELRRAFEHHGVEGPVGVRQRRAAEQRRARDPLHVLGRGPELLAAVRRDVRLAGAGAVDF
mmetsp:Transcript_6100/g.18788  ORF Transcript_6100/g.18788 Transcript_6100/m.18788 type:complete len:251 (-) Transcript_6100:491-1243(-)